MAAVETSCGTFEIALDTRGSPKTVSSFVHLAREGLYEDTLFHRIVPGFVIQGGDPLGTGRGGPGYSVDEAPPSDTEYTRGTVAMVKTAARSAGPLRKPVLRRHRGRRRPASGLCPARGGELGARRRRSDSKLGDPASGDAGTPLATVVIQTVAVSKG